MLSILYAAEVVEHDLPHIQEPWKAEIRSAIERKLTTRPEVYSRPLRRSLKGYRKLRVGEYRVILRIDGNAIRTFAIQHHSTVYAATPKRLRNKENQ